MAMFGWRDNKMPALYIAKASRDKLATSGMEKIEAYARPRQGIRFISKPKASLKRLRDHLPTDPPSTASDATP